LANLQDQPPLDIERNHWNAVETRESKWRHVEGRIVAPYLPPLGRIKERGIRQLPLDPSVQDRLQSTWKRFETNDKVCPAALQGCQGIQLPKVMIHVSVRFPEQHDSPL